MKDETCWTTAKTILWKYLIHQSQLCRLILDDLLRDTEYQARSLQDQIG